jgi:hypothetical protein
MAAAVSDPGPPSFQVRDRPDLSALNPTAVFELLPVMGNQWAMMPVPVPVPEPASARLLSGGKLGLCVASRRVAARFSASQSDLNDAAYAEPCSRRL